MGTIGYIIFFGLMFWMMRKGGGCCGGGHSSHSSTKEHNHDQHINSSTESNNSKVIEMVHDPICGMHIEKNNAVTRVVSGKKYYFCSENCAKDFIKVYTYKPQDSA
ncbi:hypothetical protein U472_10045 [Orenia metallireducens]|uniref:TRASH domain-containing protein n=1 Tax=Orenia metallireducens TaxID=1413210 RepID=A0A1C0A7W0_9FIRM|nr:YHS domain-containing protein [Orenia metallireducens]OCL26339.1 hypothetical protein U472_10045 [Orenia metallireducens]